MGALPQADDHLGVWMDPSLVERLGIQVGDVFQLTNPQNKAAAPISVEIMGIWEASDPQDRTYWSDRPLRLLDKRLLTTEDQYVRFIYPARSELTYAHTWYYVLDPQQMTFARAEHYVEALALGGAGDGDAAARRSHGRLSAVRAGTGPGAPLQPVGRAAQLCPAPARHVALFHRRHLRPWPCAFNARKWPCWPAGDAAACRFWRSSWWKCCSPWC